MTASFKPHGLQLVLFPSLLVRPSKRLSMEKRLSSALRNCSGATFVNRNWFTSGTDISRSSKCITVLHFAIQSFLYLAPLCRDPHSAFVCSFNRSPRSSCLLRFARSSLAASRLSLAACSASRISASCMGLSGSWARSEPFWVIPCKF